MKIFTLLFLLALSPASVPAASLDDAVRLYNKGEFRQAVSLLAQLKAASPDDPDVRLWLGKSYLKVRDWDKAVREMEKATQLQPANAHKHLWLGRACGARAEHSIFFKALGWARRVVKEFETARKLAPDDLDVRFDLLEFYVEAPGIVGGGKDKAKAEAQAISKLDPRKGYTARSILMAKEKKWDLAKKELIQATIDYPDDADSWKDLADYLLGRQDFEGALHYAKMALTLERRSKRILLLIAAASTQLRTGLDDSEKLLRTLAAGPLTEGEPAFEEVYYWLGECYLARGDKAKAREAFAAALAFDPEYDKAKQHVSELR